MKRILSIVLTLVMLFTLLPITALPASAEGDSEIPATAIPISSVEDLDKVGYEYPMDGYYYMTCDIDMTAATSRNGDYYNEGAGWAPIGSPDTPFTGTFNGLNHTITGLNINRNDNYVGLFAVISNATICNIRFVNTNITNSSGFCGIIALAENDSTIKNITSVNSEVTGGTVGGICGYNKATVDNCTNDGIVTGKYAGGICGATSGTVMNCTNKGQVNPLSNEAWLSGIGGATITGCVNYAIINAVDFEGAGDYYRLHTYGIGGKEIRLCGNYGTVNGRGGRAFNSNNRTYECKGDACGISGDATSIDSCFNCGQISTKVTYTSYGEGTKTNYADIYTCDSKRSVNIGTINNCFSTNCGGYFVNVGPNNNSGNIEIKNCYKLGAESATVYKSEGKVTLNLRQMKLESSFADWDFETVWTMGGNEEYLYPELQGLPIEYTKKLVGISMATDPDKLIYLEAKDELDITGGQIKLKYDNDTTEKIPITADMVSGFDNTKVGKQTIKVTYSGFETSFDITIVGKSLSSIALTTLPEKLTYLEAKDELDVTGGELTLYYNNGTSETKELAVSMVSGFDNTKVGPQELTVTFGSKTTTYDVEILEKTLTGIEVAKLPTKTEYLEAKDNLNLTGGKLTLHFDNDTTEEISMTDSSVVITGFSNKKVGEQTLKVFYRGFTTEFKVTVNAKSVIFIAIANEPEVVTYLEAKDELDVTGGQIRVFYNNDTEAIIDMTPDMVSGFDNTIVGQQVLTVTYGGQTTVCEIEIVAKTLTGIEIKNLPAKLTYRESKDELDVTGGRLTLHFNNDTTETIDMTKQMVTGFDNTVVGKQTVTVKYKGFTETFEVEIIEKRLVAINLTTSPNKLTYIGGLDSLDTTGGKITLFYDNDSQNTVDLTQNMVSGFDNTKCGQQTLTITYGGKTATYDVEVLHAYIEQVTAPTCTEQGYISHTCGACGHNYIDAYSEALGHNFVNGICTRCGDKDPNYIPPLAAPTITLSNVASSGKIKITWTAVEGAAKYEIWRATSKGGEFTRLSTTSGTRLTNTSTTAGKTYYYKVRAVAADGTLGDFSNVKYRACDCAQPVVKLTNVASSGKIKISWRAITGATKYEVWRATSKTGTYTKISTTTGTSLTNTSAVAGKTYYYKVKAICGANSSGNSAFSSIRYLTCDCARPVVKITTSSGHPKLSWAKVEGATKYEVYRATSKDGTYTKITTTTKLSYTNTTAKAGKTYYYKVKAVCGATTAGNSAYSTVVSIKATK